MEYFSRICKFFFRDKLFVLKNILDIKFQETQENKKTNQRILEHGIDFASFFSNMERVLKYVQLVFAKGNYLGKHSDCLSTNKTDKQPFRIVENNFLIFLKSLKNPEAFPYFNVLKKEHNRKKYAVGSFLS